MPRYAHVIAGLLLAGALVALEGSALNLQLAGDDYEWAQLAHEAAVHHGKLFAPLGQFFRPLATWTLVFDRTIWGTNAFGYHLTNLVLQLVAGILVSALLLRVGVRFIGAWLGGLIWATAPFTLEAAVWPSVRHDQTLLIGWLTMLLAWPSEAERWSRSRVGFALVGGVIALLSKETWVVTPALVLAAELGLRKRTLRAAAAPAVAATAAAVLYTALHFAAIPGLGGYYALRPSVLAKLPHMAAAFLSLEMPHPAPARITAVAVIGSLAVAGILVLGLRRRAPAAAVGIALLLAPLVPVLAVQNFPLRYEHAPFAGFILIVAGTAAALTAELSAAGKNVARGLGALVVAAYVAANVFLVRATLLDYGRISEAHASLLAQARAATAGLPLDRPVLVARAEADNPLLDIARTAKGVPQFYFVRHDDPDGLVETAALFEWASGRDDIAFRRYDDWGSRFAGRPGVGLFHFSDRFDAPVALTDVGAAARGCVERRQHFRVIAAEPLPSSTR